MIAKFGAGPELNLKVNFNLFFFPNESKTDSIYLFIVLGFKGNKISSSIISNMFVIKYFNIIKRYKEKRKKSPSQPLQRHSQR